jgi:hypothetical protein
MGLSCHLHVCELPPSINFRIPEPIFYEIWFIYHVTWAHLDGVLPSHQYVCLYVYPAIVARQQLGKNVTAAMNTHILEKLFDAWFSMRSVLYQWKVWIYFFPELLVVLWLSLIYFRHDLLHVGSRDSVVGIATGYGLTTEGSEFEPQ